MQSSAVIYIVDDDAAVRKALSLLMKSEGYVSRPCASAKEFFKRYDASTVSSCMLLDIRMPGMSGLELQKKLVSDNIHIPVIIMSGHGDISMAVQAMQNGAKDFLEKPFSNPALLDRIGVCLKEQSEQMLKKKHDRDVQERLAQLTPREREIMQLLLAGKLNKQVASVLNLSVRTVEGHRAKIMEKLQINSLLELTQMTQLGGHI